MDNDRLNKLVQQPNKVDASDINFLNELIAEYPYFQAPRVLLANASKESEEIKTAAVYTAHRSVLKKVINQKFDADINLPTIENLELNTEDFNAFENLEEETNFEDSSDTSFTVFKNEELSSLTEEESTTEDFPFEKESELPMEETSPPPLEALFEDKETTDSDSTEIPFQDVSFDEPLYDFPDTEEESFLSADEDELEIFNQEDLPNDSQNLSSSYDELMASLEELKRTRDINASSDVFQEERTENDQYQEEIVVDTNEQEEKEIEKAPENVANEEPSLSSTSKEGEPASESSLESTNSGFAMDSFLDEYDKDLEHSKVPHLPKAKETNSNGFALDSFLDEVYEKPAQPTRKSNSSQQEIIDAFISSQPKIKISQETPQEPKTYKQEDLAKNSVENSSMAVSENLAQILTKQGKFDKSIEIYEALMLKYPNKKAYFAAQIESLENKK